MDEPRRKPTRLSGFDYNAPGAYFLTICTQGKRLILGRIVGGGAHDAPAVQLSSLGKIVDQHIRSGNRIPGVHVDKYVIMPNHIHLILLVDFDPLYSVTAPANAKTPHFVSTLKRFCHKSAGFPIFQRNYHDHIIRGEEDYRMIWQYIENNPASWLLDRYFGE